LIGEDALDERYMRLALRLAAKGAGRTSPNPMVGAVVVRKGRVVATGHHRRAGADHAEVVALKRAGVKAKGATLYLNLEPCDHYGRTPPCAPLVISRGIKRVVVGMKDPNPLVSGRGIRRLRRAGLAVRVGVLEDESRRLNEAFVKSVRRGLPFVTLKLAASLDGKIATLSGQSRWVTGAAARAYVHRLRAQVDAVIVGVGTVLADDPRLTCRVRGGRDPWRVVIDGRLRASPTAQVFRRRDPDRTIVATTLAAPTGKAVALKKRGARIWRLPARRGIISFKDLLKRLREQGVASVMIEGGAGTAALALRERVVDKLVLFYAPKLIGGDGKSMIGSLAVERIARSLVVDEIHAARVGRDLLVSGYLAARRRR
jgi:diaminohydroxyphosphoribosylaminopyrimidine deaminase/5-amino-6-(5-phosphoribosylamino)uracil reductase